MTTQHRGKGRAAATVVLASLVVVAGVGWWTGWQDQRDDVASPVASRTTTPSASPTAQPATTTWSPTPGERAKARTVADGLSLEELAGQLIVARSFSNETSLALVRDKHFAGVMVTGNKILDVTTDDPLTAVKAFNQQLRAAGEA